MKKDVSNTTATNLPIHHLTGATHDCVAQIFKEHRKVTMWQSFIFSIPKATRECFSAWKKRKCMIGKRHWNDGHGCSVWGCHSGVCRGSTTWQKILSSMFGQRRNKLWCRRESQTQTFQRVSAQEAFLTFVCNFERTIKHFLSFPKDITLTCTFWVTNKLHNWI